jgi:hypothetical protein
MAKDDDTCHECHGTDLDVVNMREVRSPDSGAVVVRKIEVRCRDCGWTDFILKRIPN